jgi:hypothetical protein
MKIDRIKEMFGLSADTPAPADHTQPLNLGLLHTELEEERESAKHLLDDEGGLLEKKVQEEAEQTVQSAAEDTLKKLHFIQMGRCPDCGEHLNRHLFASICESCGWHDFEVPRSGPVRIHLQGREEAIEGDRCYFVKPDAVLVVRNDVVIAKINRSLASWIEYGWTAEEIDQRHRQILDQVTLRCGWCNQSCDAEKDGFHSVQIAFGATQERYTFCSDDCYEAFRKMYPARVHRDCYERNCATCNLCIKRFDDETEQVRLLAKDVLQPPRKD